MDYWKNLFSTGYRNSDNHLDVTPSQSSAIVSILSAGTFFGALASPFFADTIGRRFGLIASAWVFILGVILQTIATAIPLFLAGRFFAGFGVGLISALSKFSTRHISRHMSEVPVEDMSIFPFLSISPILILCLLSPSLPVRNSP